LIISGLKSCVELSNVLKESVSGIFELQLLKGFVPDDRVAGKVCLPPGEQPFDRQGHPKSLSELHFGPCGVGSPLPRSPVPAAKASSDVRLPPVATARIGGLYRYTFHIVECAGLTSCYDIQRAFDRGWASRIDQCVRGRCAFTFLVNGFSIPLKFDGTAWRGRGVAPQGGSFTCDGRPRSTSVVLSLVVLSGHMSDGHWVASTVEITETNAAPPVSDCSAAKTTQTAVATRT
jgi:hypothetical protein